MQKSQVCQCVDSGCLVHQGVPVCFKKSACVLYRVDMTDYTGTPMCPKCANDAYESGLYSDSPNKD